jgi:glycosyltransferase involved in cell wall biosynthesis
VGRVRWVAFGTYDRTRHPRVGVLLDGLRASGDEVSEVNEPLRLDTASRIAMLRQPWRLPILAAKLVRCWTVLAWRAREVRRDPPDAVLIGYLGHFDVRLARRLFGQTPVVLDHLISAAGTARDRRLAGSGGVKGRLMRAIDDAALGDADIVVVDTYEHQAALPATAARKAVLAPVGASEEWFEIGRAKRPRATDGPLRVIFVGVFTPLHGARTIGEALAELADDDIDVTMVGTGQDYAACRKAAAANQRITWLDWVPGAELPLVVGSHDVCLGIFGTGRKALDVVPTKVYQGAAAGCAIVTSDTPPQRAALADAALFVPPGDAKALAAALRALAEDRSEVAYLGAAAYTHAVAHYTPASVVRRLRSAMGQADGSPYPGP